MAALQIQESGGKGAPGAIVTSKGKSLRGTGVSFLRVNFDNQTIVHGVSVKHHRGNMQLHVATCSAVTALSLADTLHWSCVII